MKTFQQFCEDAASQYRAGQLAYQSSPEAKLSARRADAARKSNTLEQDFEQKSKRQMQRQKEKYARMRQEYQRNQEEIKQKQSKQSGEGWLSRLAKWGIKELIHAEELQLEQVPVMKPNEYNKQIAMRQATQKSAHIKHVHGELGAEARAQQAAKQSRLKTIMSR